jgi:hypothetical protein
MTDPKHQHDSEPPDEASTRPPHDHGDEGVAPRGNPPVDTEAVDKGREVLERVKPY